jgi:hypothetical protein
MLAALGPLSQDQKSIHGGMKKRPIRHESRQMSLRRVVESVVRFGANSLLCLQWPGRELNPRHADFQSLEVISCAVAVGLHRAPTVDII